MWGNCPEFHLCSQRGGAGGAGGRLGLRGQLSSRGSHNPPAVVMELSCPLTRAYLALSRTPWTHGAAPETGLVPSWHLPAFSLYVAKLRCYPDTATNKHRDSQLTMTMTVPGSGTDRTPPGQATPLPGLTPPHLHPGTWVGEV